MSRTQGILLSAVAACAAFVFAVPAEAQARRDRDAAVRSAGAPPLTIRKRSFLDPGPVVPPRSMHNYVTMGNAWALPVYTNQRGRMGLETLPRRFDPPGRPQPLFEF